jgi:hypothetical protein
LSFRIFPSSIAMFEGGRTLTIFACPKPFTDPHIAMIQRNAIKSWTLLKPTPQVILIGDEAGVEEAANRFGVMHCGAVARNAHNTPLLSSVFSAAETLTQADVLLYVNADIILLQDVIDAISSADLAKNGFLIGGRPYDVEISRDLTVSELSRNLGEEAKRCGRLRAVTATDWFCYRRGSWAGLPEFTIGRCYFDNALLCMARRKGFALIDATHAVAAIHQRHGYPTGLGGANYLGNAEALDNLRLAGGWSGLMDWTQANYRIIRREPEFDLVGWVLGLRWIHWARMTWRHQFYWPLLRLTRPIRRRIQRRAE